MPLVRSPLADKAQLPTSPASLLYTRAVDNSCWSCWHFFSKIPHALKKAAPDKVITMLYAKRQQTYPEEPKR